MVEHLQLADTGTEETREPSDEQATAEALYSDEALDVDFYSGESSETIEKKLDGATETERLQAGLLEKYGVSVRETEGEYEYFFRAGGKENVVGKSDVSDTALKQTGERLARLTLTSMLTMERQYQVTFAKPGEQAVRTVIQADDCSRSYGEQAYAVLPTLPQLYAVEQALARSQPSQAGMKFYFLDRQTQPPVYGGKPVLGFYTSTSRDNRPVFYITPDGGKLPPTMEDTKPGEKRWLSWAIIHEITHNSQSNNWGPYSTPPQIARSLGWHLSDGRTSAGWSYRVASLKGKDGGFYGHGKDDCTSPSVWYARNSDGHPINEQGERVDSIAEAQHFTDEEMMDKALVRPISYYFMNPKEMMSEGLTAYRSGRETRARLLRESPHLYEVVARYDQHEVNMAYGVIAGQGPKYIRNPDGLLVASTRQSLQAIADFHDQNTPVNAIK